MNIGCGNKLKNVVRALCVFALLTPVFIPAVASAEESAIAQGFKTSETNLAIGAIMSLKAGDVSTVELATSDTIGRMVGAVSNRALVDISEADKQVQVVTSGSAQVLVSDINGDVRSGDKITASPIAGVGMKADENSQVLGTAQSSLADASRSERTITDKNGTGQKVNVGLIGAQIHVTFYSSTEQKNFLPAFLQAFANTVAGRSVSPVRVVVAVLVLLLGFVSIGVLLYSAVRSSIISIGRNPLSERAVNKSLLEVGATAIGILLVMVIAIYLILRI